MSEEIEMLKLICSRLETAEIPYMLTGSMAGNYYTVPRMTRDIDIVVEIFEADSERFCNAFGEDDFYIDRESIEDAIKHKSMFNIIHNNLILKIDFVIRKGAPYRRIEFERRRKIDLDGTQIWIVAPEDLIISKLLWSKDRSSDIQLRDVKNLLASVRDLDEEYIAQWVQALDLESVYKQVKIDE